MNNNAEQLQAMQDIIAGILDDLTDDNNANWWIANGPIEGNEVLFCDAWKINHIYEKAGCTKKFMLVQVRKHRDDSRITHLGICSIDTDANKVAIIDFLTLKYPLSHQETRKKIILPDLLAYFVTNRRGYREYDLDKINMPCLKVLANSLRLKDYMPYSLLKEATDDLRKQGLFEKLKSKLPFTL